jgi:hypothetical protein
MWINDAPSGFPGGASSASDAIRELACKTNTQPMGSRGDMRHGLAVLWFCIALGACTGSKVPPPDSVRATYDRNAHTIHVDISNAQMPRNAWLVDVNGTRYPLILSLLSGPHVNYSAPPSIGLGLGGFGWNVGGGAGVGFPLGSPHPTSIDNQFIASATVQAPLDYPQRWSQYHVIVDLGTQGLEVAAPSPTRS